MCDRGVREVLHIHKNLPKIETDLVFNLDWLLFAQSCSQTQASAGDQRLSEAWLLYENVWCYYWRLHRTFAFGHAAGVKVGRGGSLRTGLTLQLTLLVLVGAQPAALTLMIFQGEVRSHWTLDCKGTYN